MRRDGRSLRSTMRGREFGNKKHSADQCTFKQRNKTKNISTRKMVLPHETKSMSKDQQP